MTEARAISPSGEIVGSSIDFARLVTRAVLWRRGVITQLGTLPGGNYSEARGISPSGEIVGYATAADGQFHAVKWTVR
jgi:probable HAF family extracellular repeat protein